MATRIWTGAATTAWGTAGNWSPATVPVTGDDVIFDGRSTVNAVTSLDQTGVNLLSMTVFPTYTGTIGTPTTAEGPLIIECSGTIILEGSGDFYIQCGNDAADADIANMIINTTGTVGLSSQKNAVAGNISLFEDVRINKGTVLVFGDADKANTNAESGTYIHTLWVQPQKARKTGVVVTIGNICQDLKDSGVTDIEMREGVLTTYSRMNTVRLSAGTLTFGGVDYPIATAEDGISSLIQQGGIFNWRPNETASATSVASGSPGITLMHLYAGTFNASKMASTSSTNPAIQTLHQYAETTMDLDNGYANFNIVTYNKYGGKLKTTAGQDITFA